MVAARALLLHLLVPLSDRLQDRSKRSDTNARPNKHGMFRPVYVAGGRPKRSVNKDVQCWKTSGLLSSQLWHHIISMICLLILEVIVKLVRPLTDPPDMDAEGILHLERSIMLEVLFLHFHLRCRTDCERMPLKSRNLGDLDEDPVARAVVELGRLFDLKASDPARERDALRDRSCPPPKKGRDCSVDQLNSPDTAKCNKPLPEIRGVQEEEEEVEDIVEVGEVEDEEVAAPSHSAQTAAHLMFCQKPAAFATHHDGQDDNQSDSSWVGCASYSPKDSYVM